MDLSVISIIGIILLIGIVQKNGIMLVDFAVVAERERALPPVAAVREACLLRFRPILMTTAATLLAGLPMAFSHGTGSELRRPLGYCIVGGLALSPAAHTLYDTRRVPLPRSPPTLDIGSPAEPEIRSCDHCGRPPAPHDGNRHHVWAEWRIGGRRSSIGDRMTAGGQIRLRRRLAGARFARPVHLGKRTRRV
jgi:hypothetical protein